MKLSIRPRVRARQQFTQHIQSTLTAANLTARSGVELPAAIAFDQWTHRLHNAFTDSLRNAVVIAGQAPLLAESSALAEQAGGQLTEAAAQLASASEEISVTVSRELGPTAETMHQLAADTAREVSACDTQGQAVGDLMSAMRDDMARLQERIRTVDQQADEMQRIVGMIAEISRQTNLLALNAAIEAARAGEAGRGFTVVADEVRALAHRTMQATDEVETRIGLIRSEVTVLTEGGSTVRERVEQGVEGIDDIRGRLAHSRTSMAQLEDCSRQVATGTTQIGNAIQGVTQDVQGIAGNAQRLMENAASLSSGSQTIRHHGDHLLETLGVFQLDWHAQARRDVAMLAAEPALMSPHDTDKIEQTLRAALARSGQRFELLYLVAPDGRQISANIHPDWVAVSYEGSGRGRDWSDRPWFTAARDTLSSYVSPIYRSVATDEYSFTVSVPVMHPDHGLVAILGADVRLVSFLDT